MSTTGPLTFRLLHDPTAPIVAQIIDIYRESIPATERKPQTWIAQAVQRSDFRVLAATSDDDAVGFATLFVPHGNPPPAWSLLEYLAVDQRSRGRGVGAAIFRQILAMMLGRAVLLEVDSNRDPSPQAQSARRIEFYRRLGCRRIEGVRYVLPLDTTPPPPEMDLMIAQAPPGLTMPQVRQWVRIIYESVYDQRRDDARIDAMFAATADLIELK